MLLESTIKWKVRIGHLSYSVAMVTTMKYDLRKVGIGNFSHLATIVITQKIDLNESNRNLVIYSLVLKVKTQGGRQFDAFRKLYQMKG